MPGSEASGERFSDAAGRSLADLHPEAYASGGEVQRGQRAALELIESLVGELADGPGAQLLGRLRGYLEAESVRASLYDGVSAARPDHDGGWEKAFAAVNARAVGAGAVHLELGAWSAYPEARHRELVAADGLGEFIRLDFDARHELDVVGDAQALPFADASIDRIRADSVLEHLAYPHAVLAECYRVLRPGGWMMCATPWVFNLHGYPADYLRYSPSFFELAFGRAGFERVEVDTSASSGLYYTLHNCAKAAFVPASEPQASVLQALHTAVMTLLAALAPLDQNFEDRRTTWFHSVQAFAVKPGVYVPSGRSPEPQGPLVRRSLDLLVCPSCKGSVRWHRRRLRCDRCRRTYPVIRDVPHLIAYPRRSLPSRVWRRLRHPWRARRSRRAMPGAPPPPVAGS